VNIVARAYLSVLWSAGLGTSWRLP